jgi:hypothetical protein
MNLAGRDERLRLVKSITARRRFRHRDAKGDQFIELYRGGDATVQLIKTITFPCKPPYELCDLVEMKAVITVTKGEQRETIRAEGGCGNGEP